MTIDRLHASLVERVGDAIQDAFNQFRATSDKPDDADALLAYLHEHGLIDQSLLAELLDMQQVEVTIRLGDEPSESLSRSESMTRVVAALRDVAPRACTGCGQPIIGGTAPRVMAEIGRGAMGAIHVARDAELGRKVAYKRLKQEASHHEPLVQRFLSEAQITAQLDHPNIVPVYTLALDGEGPAYTMKLIRGQTFRQLLDKDREARDAGQPGTSLSAYLEQFVKVCDALHYAHCKGVLHRDLKPANIMVGRYGEVYVMDWGVASIRDTEVTGVVETARVDLSGISLENDDATATQEGQLVGTPAYMSPEQANGHNADLDARSDQFSLGLILFQLATLRRAIEGASAREVLANARLGRLAHLEHDYGDRVPAELGDIIARSTAYDRDERYPDVGEMADDLRRFLRGEPVRAHRYSQLERLRRFVARHANIALAVTSAALLVSAAAVVYGLERGRAVIRAELDAHQRQQQLGEFLSRVNRRARALDGHFAHYESLLVGFAASVDHALHHGVPSEDPVFFDRAMIASPDARPADMVDSAGYRRPISPTQLVVKVVEGVDDAAVMPDVRRVAALRPAMRQLILDSHPDLQRRRPRDEAVQRRLILERATPVSWVYVALQKGAHISFPGKFGYGAGYDPRKRPWFHYSTGRAGAVWGTPYVDIGGQGLVLPCTVEIRAPDGQRVAVAAIDLTFDYLIAHLLTLPEEPAVLETYLVDDRGRELIRSSERGKQVAIKLTGKQSRDAPPLGIPRAHRAIVTGEQDGVFVFDTDTGPRLVSFSRLSTLDWYYVVVVDPEALRDSPPSPSNR